VSEIANIAPEIGVIVGFPEIMGNNLYNRAVILVNGRILDCYRKQKLPNDGVFDEKRYFSAGNQTCVFAFKSQIIGLVICEDAWHLDTIQAAKFAGAQLLLSVNASPFQSGKAQQRENMLSDYAKKTQLPIVYINAVGGQDELIFDGGSFVTDAQGNITFRASEFESEMHLIEFIDGHPAPSFCAPSYTPIVSEYKALVLGIRDYVQKNGFKGAILGLSGGIDSALVLTLAVDALGAKNVDAVSLPSRYTQLMSIDDAKLQTDWLGVNYHCISIEPAVLAFSAMLTASFANTPTDTTEENIQARCRAVVLMALSNKQGKLLLTTGNKSEMSVGYATLYGDMAGGFAPLKDVPKLLVYQLARYRNTLSPAIPERVLTRPPSAELAPNQKDSDSLPPYDILDPILQRYLEENQSADEIIAAGFSADDVKRTLYFSGQE
jgi:NAD+ synthase (glutamine-hydrolysing)